MEVSFEDIQIKLSHKYFSQAVVDGESMIINKLVENDSQATAILVQSLLRTVTLISCRQSEQKDDELKILLTSMLDSCFDETNATIKLLNLDCVGSA